MFSLLNYLIRANILVMFFLKVAHLPLKASAV